MKGKFGPIGRVTRWGRGDIEPIGSPAISVEQWRDFEKSLEVCREWAERHALQAITWYLRDKRIKRLGSRTLRLLAIIGATLGGLAPLIEYGTHLGYIALVLAAGCIGFDHFFGLSSGWMRGIATAQALQARLVRFQLNWESWQAKKALLLASAGAGEDSVDIDHGFDLIEELVINVYRLTENETAKWMNDLSVAMISLRQHAGSPLINERHMGPAQISRPLDLSGT